MLSWLLATGMSVTLITGSEVGTKASQKNPRLDRLVNDKASWASLKERCVWSLGFNVLMPALPCCAMGYTISELCSLLALKRCFKAALKDDSLCLKTWMWQFVLGPWPRYHSRPETCNQKLSWASAFLKTSPSLSIICTSACRYTAAGNAAAPSSLSSSQHSYARLRF